MTPQERAEKIAQLCLCGESARYAIAEAVRVAIVEATNDELEKRRAAETVIEILTQRLGYIASVAAPGEEDDRQPTLVEGEDKPPEPHVWHDRTRSKRELKSAQCFCWSCRKHRGEVPDGPG